MTQKQLFKLNSIMHDDKTRCYVCGGRSDEIHHVIHGTKYNKRFSEENGLIVGLCRACHTEVHCGGSNLDWKLKQAAQREFCCRNDIDEWMRNVGRNYEL